MKINYKKLNPLGFHLLKLLQDAVIRLIILYGGSSSGKTYSVAQLILIITLYDGENTLVMQQSRCKYIQNYLRGFQSGGETVRYIGFISI